MMARRSLTLLSALLALPAGCRLGPDFEVPEMEVPTTFRQSSSEGESIANMQWWELFGDPQLQRLIERAIRENQDLGIAQERVAEAQAQLGIVRADQLPSLGYSASAARQDIGSSGQFGAFPPFSNFFLGATLFQELDLWGKLSRATEAARAELVATEAQYADTMITLVAEVAASYLLLLDLDDRLVITQRTLESRQGATQIMRDRFREGVVARLDVHYAEIEEATAEVAIAQLQRSIAQTENVLRVLLGRNPGGIERGLGLEEQLPLRVPAGLPSDLLQRRPDILIAESIAHAETARIGVAEALRFPTINLTGSLGWASGDIDDLITSQARSWSVAADAVGPIFEFDRNVRRVDSARSRARQSVLDYERTVLQAFREVEDSLVALRTFREETQIRDRQVEAARGAARLTRALYDEQYVSYIEVLDAERSLFQAELERSAALRAAQQSIVELYRSLGGGWQRPQAEDAEDVEGDESASTEETDSESSLPAK